MRTNQTFIPALLAVGILLASGAVQAAPGDVELWNTDKVGIGLSEQWALTFEQEFRLAEGDLHYEHTDAGLKLALMKGLSTSLRYRNVVEFDGGETDMEHRPHWNLSGKLGVWGGFGVKNNLRIEYRIREGKDNNVRYRDRATVSYKWGRVGTYVSDEIFVEKGEFIRNRLYFGIDAKVISGLKVGGFYMRRTQAKDEWAATHMVGLTVAVSTDLHSPGGRGLSPRPSSKVIGQNESATKVEAESTPAIGRNEAANENPSAPEIEPTEAG